MRKSGRWRHRDNVVISAQPRLSDNWTKEWIGDYLNWFYHYCGWCWVGRNKLKKDGVLFQSPEKSGKDARYFAFDLLPHGQKELMFQFPVNKFKYFISQGLRDTYDDRLAWSSRSENGTEAQVFNIPTKVSLDFSVGTLTPPESVEIIGIFSSITSPRHTLLVDLDTWPYGDGFWHAYNDKKGTTPKICLNELNQANAVSYGKARA